MVDCKSVVNLQRNLAVCFNIISAKHWRYQRLRSTPCPHLPPSSTVKLDRRRFLHDIVHACLTTSRHTQDGTVLCSNHSSIISGINCFCYPFFSLVGAGITQLEWRLGCSLGEGFDSLKKREFCLLQDLQTGSGAPSVSHSCLPLIIPKETKRPEHQVNHSWR